MGQVIHCQDAYGCRLEEHTFSRVYSSKKDFDSHAYNTSIAPLIRESISGSSTLAVFGGPASQNINTYLVSKDSSNPGLLYQSAEQLLVAANTVASQDGMKQGAVTFSWFTFDCNHSDAITDVLRTASSSNSSTSSVPSASSSTSSSASGNPDLILRELGKGRGMTVPGLWEVELTSASDVDAVVNHVQKIVTEADHNHGNLHTVMQFTVTTHRSAQKINKTNSGDPPGLGRFSFLILSNLMPPSRRKSPEGRPPTLYPWVDHVSSITEWLGSRRPSPPFHKSRLLLFLRDILCGRQIATLNLLVSPTKDEDLFSINGWLNIIQQLSNKDHLVPPQISSSPSGNATSTSVATTSYPIPSLYTSDSLSSVSSGNETSHTVSKNIITKNSTYLSETERSLSASMRQRASPLAGDILASELKGSLNDALSSHDTYINGSHNDFPYQKNNQFVSSSSSSSSSTSSPSKSITKHYSAHTEQERFLSSALEQSQEEIKSLKANLDAAISRYETCQSAYDALVLQLREEGSMLMKKDQERYRKALRDLRDYEIYKEVMEAAIVKVQSEFENVSKENKDIRAKLNSRDAILRKGTKDSIKNHKDLIEAKKRIESLENETKELKKQLRKAKQGIDESTRGMDYNSFNNTTIFSKMDDILVQEKCSETENLKKR